jgi:SAM-dependent methyltransferase
VDPDAVIDAERAVRDAQAGEYDALHPEEDWSIRVEDACLLDALSPEPGQTILDAGCGTGRALATLLGEDRRVIGVDHSAPSLEVARGRVPAAARDRLSLRLGDVRDLPVKDGEVDGVWCCGVLQHVPSAPYRAEALRELRRTLRPGGVLALSAYRWLGHVRRHKEGFWDGGLYRYAFTPREMGRLLAEAGFADVAVGGAVIAPGIAERLGMSVAAQRRLAFTPLGRTLAHYVIARARRPA